MGLEGVLNSIAVSDLADAESRIAIGGEVLRQELIVEVGGVVG